MAAIVAWEAQFVHKKKPFSLGRQSGPGTSNPKRLWDLCP